MTVIVTSDSSEDRVQVVESTPDSPSPAPVPAVEVNVDIEKEKDDAEA